MRFLTTLTALICAAAICGEPTTTTRVPDLVAQLGSANYQEREAAFRALDELGQAALGDLRAALASPDSEIARRASELVRRIRQFFNLAA